MPSYEQLFKTVQILQSLSDLEREILLFMYDQDEQEFYVVAGKTDLLKITINNNCQVEILLDEL
jgi:hypothetical protein